MRRVPSIEVYEGINELLVELHNRAVTFGDRYPKSGYDPESFRKASSVANNKHRRLPRR
jgi:hypothetical protein